MPDYTKPNLFCDLVMKGGITSGVVYPKAVTRLAQVYTFKNIGGTSAGAIAAAATAAAECGRQTGRPESFVDLDELPQWIGGAGRLLHMFEPQAATAPLFQLFIAAMDTRGIVGKAIGVIGAIARGFPLFCLLAALAGALAEIAGSGIAMALLIAVVLLVIFLVWRVAHIFMKSIPTNFYGMSKAFDPSNRRADGPLSNWLTGYLDALANRKPDDAPLTCGDLHRVGVNLEVMTTAVNHGRPYRLPFRDPDQVFFFREDDFRTLFPARVVEYMVQHQPARVGIPPVDMAGNALCAFPDAEHLPVIVATRMSLSFPILLSAVPLYAVDFSRTFNQDNKKVPTAERCWFSDGGICSNLPIHFFDQPLPGWPTFAINLKQFHPDHQAEEDAVWLPLHNNSGWSALWTRFELAGQLGSPLAFLGAILNAMQNWVDNTLSRVPGYRDRMTHVSQRDDEGGLNLNMSAEAITRLASRGSRAGDLLVERFVNGGGWTNHEWVRFRSTLDVTTNWLIAVQDSYDPRFAALLPAPPSYKVPKVAQQDFMGGVHAILGAAAVLSNAGPAITNGAPRPEPELRIRPKI